MTVNYNKLASTSKPWTFFKLLLTWKASIWKAVYLELLVFLTIYGIISVVYRCALGQQQQKYRSFETVVRYFDSRLSYIPLELVLGFFCTQIINRWTKQYETIGFIDNIGLMTALYVRGRSERARLYRRNILRYCELMQVLVFRDISMRTRKRLPTLDTIVAAGFMLPHEKELFETFIDHNHTPKYWIPANWALAMTYQAWKHGYIESDYYKITLQEEIKKWRTNLEWVFNYDWVPLPLMYPQVVCLAVHLYFLVCTLSRQYVVSEHALNKTEIDVYFPIMTALQFVFYMGWMKVIEVVLNPFGEDDDDFETNALIDRNITMGMMIVDQGYDHPPDLLRDPFWDEIHPLYSEETACIRNNPPKGSISHVKLAHNVKEVIMMPHGTSSDGIQMQIEKPKLRRSTVRVKDEERVLPRQSKTTLMNKLRKMINQLLVQLWNLLRSPFKKYTTQNNIASNEEPQMTHYHNSSPLPSHPSPTIPPILLEKEIV